MAWDRLPLVVIGLPLIFHIAMTDGTIEPSLFTLSLSERGEGTKAETLQHGNSLSHEERVEVRGLCANR